MESPEGGKATTEIWLPDHKCNKKTNFYAGKRVNSSQISAFPNQLQLLATCKLLVSLGSGRADLIFILVYKPSILNLFTNYSKFMYSIHPNCTLSIPITLEYRVPLLKDANLLIFQIGSTVHRRTYILLLTRQQNSMC